MFVPSGGHVMSNGLHMLRGGKPIQAMSQAQGNWIKKYVIQYFGDQLIKDEVYREAFFREKAINALLSACVPLSRACLVGGVQSVVTAENAIAVDGFGAIMVGRVLLADPDWCIKVGIVNPSATQSNVLLTPLQVCDQSNQCIVGATMALKPLRCTKYTQAMDW